MQAIQFYGTVAAHANLGEGKDRTIRHRVCFQWLALRMSGYPGLNRWFTLFLNAAHHYLEFNNNMLKNAES